MSAMCWLQAGLLLVTVSGKGGFNLGGFFDTFSSRRRAYTPHAYSDHSTAGYNGYSYTQTGYSPILLQYAGARRRYGTFVGATDGYGTSGSCQIASELDMRNACGNLMADESQCFMCQDCETESCIASIVNCDEYLSASYYECNEDGYDTAFVVFICCIVLWGLLAYCCFAFSRRSAGVTEHVVSVPPPPTHTVPHSDERMAFLRAG